MLDDVRPEAATAAPEAKEAAQPDPPQATTVKPKRQVSTVEFPYYDLDSVIEVARRINGHVGRTSATTDQVAAWIDSTPTSGTFKLKMSACRMFGLLIGERGSVRLTELGSQIVDPATERQARVDAFLSVELYRKIYEANRNRLLPPPSGLENEMVQFGVAPAQKERARQTFDRSARQAGFFEYANDRLVKPPIHSQADASAPNEEVKSTVDQPKGPSVGKEEVNVADDPLIRGLLQRMPPVGAGWPLDDRVRWLQTFAMSLSLIYGPDEKGDIEVKTKPSLNQLG